MLFYEYIDVHTFIHTQNAFQIAYIYLPLRHLHYNYNITKWLKEAISYLLVFFSPHIKEQMMNNKKR